MVIIVRRILFQTRVAVGVAAALAASLVCACGAQPAIQYVPQKVEVPVVQAPPRVAVPPVPVLAIQRLTSRSSDAEMMAAWVASVEQLKADDQRLRALLAPYAQKSEPAGAP